MTLEQFQNKWKNEIEHYLVFIVSDTYVSVSLHRHIEPFTRFLIKKDLRSMGFSNKNTGTNFYR